MKFTGNSTHYFFVTITDKMQMDRNMDTFTLKRFN